MWTVNKLRRSRSDLKVLTKQFWCLTINKLQNKLFSKTRILRSQLKSQVLFIIIIFFLYLKTLWILK